MKLFELTKKKGTYAGVKFDKDTKQSIMDYMKEAHIPNALPTSKLHTTLLYSRVECPNYKPIESVKYVGEPDEFVVWETQGVGGKGKARCLVLKYKCPELVKRHKELIKEHGATHDFPSFEPHITLSYDIGDMKLSSFPDVQKHLGTIHTVGEYVESLDLDWAETKSKN
jgi:2'-5' RNA ligase